MRADALAVALLDYGHTVSLVCEMTTLPRHQVHRIAGRHGMTWHQDSDTMRRPGPEQEPEVRQIIAGMTAVLDGVADPLEQRQLRRLLATWVQRLDRALYPTTPTPALPTPPPAKARRGRPRKDRTNA